MDTTSATPAAGAAAPDRRSPGSGRIDTQPFLEVDGVTSRTADGVTLLDDVSFTVEAGEFVAVVGPTGAGKSSLANALAGAVPWKTGEIRLRGHHLAAGSAGRGRVGVVPQDDATHPLLGVRRTLEHAAALRVGGDAAARTRRVDETLAELGLTAQASTRLADLSGGQRKLANVAVELVGDPDLLVLDEPTAGLDPGLEKQVFTTLRTLADSGRTIIAITHSLRVLGVCDRVLFLAPGGTVAFFGTPADAAAYFEWDEPATAFTALASTPATQWQARFRAFQARRATTAAAEVAAPNSSTTTSTSTPAAATETAGAPAGHVGTLLRRSRDTASADGRTLKLSLAAGPILGVLLWAVLPGSTLAVPHDPDGHILRASSSALSFGFFVAMAITWLGAAGAVREVVKERHILRRERAIGVSSEEFLGAKTIFLAGIASVQAVPLALIAMFGQHLPGRGSALGSGPVEVLVVAVLVGLTAVSTGLLVSAWASNSEKALATLPVVLVAELALAGPWAAHSNIVIGIMRGAVPARWASAAVNASVVGDAGAWWLAVLALSGLFVVQLVVALSLVNRGSPSVASAPRSIEAPSGLPPALQGLLASNAAATRTIEPSAPVAPPTPTVVLPKPAVVLPPVVVPQPVQVAAAVSRPKPTLEEVIAAARAASRPTGAAEASTSTASTSSEKAKGDRSDRSSLARIIPFGLAAALALTVGISALGHGHGNAAALAAVPAASPTTAAPVTAAPAPAPVPAAPIVAPVVTTAPTVPQYTVQPAPARTVAAPVTLPAAPAATTAVNAAPAVTVTAVTTPTPKATTTTTLAVGSPLWWWQQFLKMTGGH